MIHRFFLYEKGKHMLKKIIPIICILSALMILSCSKEKTVVAKGINCEKYFSQDFLEQATSKTKDNLGIYGSDVRFSYLDKKVDSGFSAELMFNDGRIFLVSRLVHPNKYLCLNKHSKIGFGFSPQEVYYLEGVHKRNCAQEHHDKDLGNYSVGLYELPLNSKFFRQLLLNGTPKYAYVETSGDMVNPIVMDDDSDFKFANIARCIYESPMKLLFDIDGELIDNTLNLKK